MSSTHTSRPQGGHGPKRRGRSAPRLRSRRLTLERLEDRQLLTAGPTHIDFGPAGSAVAPGYVADTGAAYSAARGEGWAPGGVVYTDDRWSPQADPLTRDFAYGRDATFLVDLPDGTYNATLTLGDALVPRDQVSVWLEGQQVAAGLSSAPGQFLKPTYQVQVTGGQLALRLVDTGGATPYFSINGLDIAPVDGTFAAPSGLTASAASATTVDLAWINSANGQTGTEIQRSTDGINFSTVTLVGAGVSSFSDPGLSAGTTYTYRVRALRGAAASAFSATATATTPSPLAAPTALTATFNPPSEVDLTWVDNGGGRTATEIERSTDGNNFTVIATVAAGDSGYADKGLSPQTYYYRAQATDGRSVSGVSNTATATVSAGNGVTIDAAWLARHGNGPYVLGQPGTTYTLATDVVTEGTAFVVAAPDVVLDLNGHSVTYGDEQPVVVPNGGFEQGSGRSVPNWDVSGAPAAAVAPNTNYLFGSQVLRLANFATPQEIVSAPIPIPKANRTYEAMITPSAATEGTSVTISVVDTVTGQVVAGGASASPYHAFSALVHFVPTTTNPVVLRVDVTPPSGQSATVDLDAATLTPADDYGILASDAWSGEIPGWTNLPADAQNAYRQAGSFTVRNGHILQGQGQGYASSPLFFQQLAGFTVDGVQTFATGVDTQDLNAHYATVGVTVRNSTFQDAIANVSNRTRLIASIDVGGTNAPVLIENNDLIGSPQVGVQASHNNPAYPFVIRNNEIRQNGVVTNAYAIAVAALQNFEISGNTINPVNGRGIDIDGYSSVAVSNGQIHDNTVSVQEGPEREYGTTGEARALRLRNNVDAMGAQTNLHIFNNTFSATSGPGLTKAAYGVRIDYTNPNGAMNDANILLENNTFQAITTTADPSYHATALFVDGLAPGVNVKFLNNSLISNDTSLGLSGSDGGDVGVSDALFVGNTLSKFNGTVVRPYTGIHAGYWYYQINHVQLFDTRTANGATDDIVWSGTGTKEIETGWIVDLAVLDPHGAPASGASVTISDKGGNVVFSGITDSNGTLSGVPLVTTIASQQGSDPSAITFDKRGPFVVSAKFKGHSSEVTADPTSDLSLTLNLT